MKKKGIRWVLVLANNIGCWSHCKTKKYRDWKMRKGTADNKRIIQNLNIIATFAAVTNHFQTFSLTSVPRQPQHP